MMGEKGFLYGEVAFLGLALVAVAGLFSLPWQAANLREASKARQTAILLGEQELALLEARSRSWPVGSAPGTVGWLGEAGADEAQGASVTGRADWQPLGTDYKGAKDEADGEANKAGGWQLTVTVSYAGRAGQPQIELKKWVGAHGRGSSEQAKEAEPKTAGRASSSGQGTAPPR